MFFEDSSKFSQEFTKELQQFPFDCDEISSIDFFNNDFYFVDKQTNKFTKIMIIDTLKFDSNLFENNDTNALQFRYMDYSKKGKEEISGTFFVLVKLCEYYNKIFTCIYDDQNNTLFLKQVYVDTVFGPKPDNKNMKFNIADLATIDRSFELLCELIKTNTLNVSAYEQLIISKLQNEQFSEQIKLIEHTLKILKSQFYNAKQLLCNYLEILLSNGINDDDLYHKIINLDNNIFSFESDPDTIIFLQLRAFFKRFNPVKELHAKVKLLDETKLFPLIISENLQLESHTGEFRLVNNLTHISQTINLNGDTELFHDYHSDPTNFFYMLYNDNVNNNTQESSVKFYLFYDGHGLDGYMCEYTQSTNTLNYKWFCNCDHPQVLAIRQIDNILCFYNSYFDEFTRDHEFKYTFDQYLTKVFEHDDHMYNGNGWQMKKLNI